MLHTIKRKNFGTAVILTIVFVVSLVFSACGTNDAQSGIRQTGLKIATPPAKTVYVAGQTFDTAGLEILAVYSDGTKTAVPFKTDVSEGYAVSPADALALSDSYVILSFGGHSVIQPISVSAKAITGVAVSTPPTKTAYTAGELFSPAGMVVTATYNDGDTAVIPLQNGTTDGYTYNPSGTLTAANTTITIFYGTLSAEISISVSAIPKIVTSLAITTNPAKISYQTGESFNPAGMVVTATYGDQSTEAVTDYTYTPNGALTVDSDIITVSYGGKTARLMLQLPLTPSNFAGAFDSTEDADNAPIEFYDHEKWTTFPDTADAGFPKIASGSLNFTRQSTRRFDAFRIETPGCINPYDNIAANIGTTKDDEVFRYTAGINASGSYALYLFTALGATTTFSEPTSHAIKLSYASGKFNFQSVTGGNNNQLAVASATEANYQNNQWNRIDFVFSRKSNFVTCKIYINGLRLYFEDAGMTQHPDAKLNNGNFVFPAGSSTDGTSTLNTSYPNYGHRFGVAPASGITVRLCPVNASGVPVPSLIAPDGGEEDKDPSGIYYSDYGAVGNGITDDFAAIRAAHAAANIANKKVYADSGKVYYIGNSNQTALIQTDTDWGDAQFIIDDSAVTSNRSTWVFQISSKLTSTSGLGSVTTLKKGQTKLNRTFSTRSLIRAVDNTTKRYIRAGQNANSGADQTDIFIVDTNGNVDPVAPIIWDYDRITSATIYPIDTTPMTVKGGTFTTVANTEAVNATYFARGIRVTRSNTILDGIKHNITGEGTGDGRYIAGSTSRPYTAFIQTQYCVDVTVQNCVLTGHKVYWNNKGTTTSPNWVQQGTYDFNANSTISLTVKNCSQTNDIYNNFWWGIFTSNYSKNITFDNVTWSRFDAHQGVHNVTIKNSSLGHQGMQVIGSGKLTVENTKVRSSRFISLRNDYGSTWEGDIDIQDCIFDSTSSTPSIIEGNNNGLHDFGYPCYLPDVVTIDGLRVEGSIGSSSNSLRIFSAGTWGNGNEPFAISVPQLLRIKNLTRTNGSGYDVSPSSRLSGTPVLTSW